MITIQYYNETIKESIEVTIFDLTSFTIEDFGNGLVLKITYKNLTGDIVFSRINLRHISKFEVINIIEYMYEGLEQKEKTT